MPLMVWRSGGVRTFLRGAANVARISSSSPTDLRFLSVASKSSSSFSRSRWSCAKESKDTTSVASWWTEFELRGEKDLNERGATVSWESAGGRSLRVADWGDFQASVNRLGG